MSKAKLKRAFSLFLICVMMLTISLPVYATDADSSRTIETRYTYVLGTETSLTISGTSATCKSSCDANSSVTTIQATQTLEKHWGLGLFFGVDGASWTKTSSTRNFTMSNTKSGLVNGTYRVKTVFTVTTSSGATETVTVYSSERTI